MERRMDLEWRPEYWFTQAAGLNWTKVQCVANVQHHQSSDVVATNVTADFGGFPVRSVGD